MHGILLLVALVALGCLARATAATGDGARTPTAAAAAAVAAAAVKVEVASIPLQGNIQNSIESNTQATLAAMDAVASQAKSSGMDLIIFPEGLLWWYLPTKSIALAAAPDFIAVSNGTVIITNGAKANANANATSNAGPVPCVDMYHRNTVLGALSCMSRKHRIHIVANIATRSCDPADRRTCNNAQLFNTAVSTDATGQVLATYRKFHTYGSSPQFDAPTVPDVSFFQVRDVAIGLLVCFDIEFKAPLAALLRDVAGLQVRRHV